MTVASFESDYRKMVGASEYTLKHLVGHLINSGHTQRLLDLLLKNQAWLEANADRFGGDQRFLGDVQNTLQYLRSYFQISDLLVLVQLHMLRHIVKARVSTYEDKDLKIMTYLGKVEEALMQARLKEIDRPYYGGVFSGLKTVFQTLLEQGTFRRDILREMRAVTERIEHLGTKNEAVLALIQIFVRLGDHASAQLLLAGLSDPLMRDAAICYLHADTLQPQIQSLYWKLRFLYDSMKTQVHDSPEVKHYFTITQQYLQEITDPITKVQALLYFAETCFYCHLDTVESLLNQAIETANTIQNTRSLSHVLLEIVPVLYRTVGQKKAETLCFSIPDDDVQARAFINLVQEVLQREQTENTEALIEKAESLVSAIQNSWYQARVSLDLIDLLVMVGRLDAAKSLAQTFNDHTAKKDALRALALALGRAGYYAEASTMFQQARTMARGVTYNVNREVTLSAIVSVMVAQGYEQFATRIAHTIHDKTIREAALAELANPAIAKTFLLEKPILTPPPALLDAAAIRAIDGEEEQTQAIQRAVIHFSDQGGWLNAFDHIDFRMVHYYIQLMTRLTPTFAHIDPQLPIRILIESIRLAGWVYPGWEEVYTEIKSNYGETT